MSSCCSAVYQNKFDAQRAQKELIEYHEMGPKKTSQPLVAAVQQLPLDNCSVLDIGGGIGVQSFAALERGAAFSTHIDISQAYCQTFLNEAERQGLQDKVSSQQGDFLEVAPQLDPADLVVLDKVICCYKDYEMLVKQSVAKAGKWYAFTLPRDVWWVRWVHGTEQFFKRRKPNYFPSFVHPTTDVEQMVREAGFVKKSETTQREWQTFVFEK